MTTVIVLPREKKIYSDSRVTYGQTRHETGFKKVHKSVDGRLLASGCGDVTLIAEELVKLGIPKEGFHKDAFSSNKSDTSATILVLNKYTNTTYEVRLETNKKSIVKSRKVTYNPPCDYIIAGSGGLLASKVHARVDDAEKAITVASYIDKGTDDKIQKEVL
ncbi:conserved hypothetical protein [Vibrio phage 424E50-1]|nr:conserved hypothetical protein [Vibrio phage 424E50-1]